MPTAEPSSSPVPSAAPTLAPTIGPICQQGNGSRPYLDGTLHCLDVGDDQLASAYLVEGGLSTCSVRDANSCPNGMDIWVPTSYEHAAAVFDTYVESRTNYGTRKTKLTGIYRDADGCGACSSTAMNSEAQDAWAAAVDGRVGFTSIAPWNPWFLRSTTYNEPNGDRAVWMWSSPEDRRTSRRAPRISTRAEGPL